MRYTQAGAMTTLSTVIQTLYGSRICVTGLMQKLLVGLRDGRRTLYLIEIYL